MNPSKDSQATTSFNCGKIASYEAQDMSSSEGKKQWRTGKYAPSRMPANGNAEHNKIFRKRQDKVRAEYKIKEQLTEDLIQKANEKFAIRNIEGKTKMKNSAQKREARKFFAKRHPELSKNAADPSHYLGYSNNQRLRIYNRHHKCPHNLAHNKIFRSGDKYIFSCTHDHNELIDLPENMEETRCENCGAKIVRNYVNKQCGCESQVCFNRCGYSTFRYSSTTNAGKPYTYHQFYDKHSAHQFIVDVDPLWKRGEIKPLEIDLKSDIYAEFNKLSFMSQIDKKKRRVDRKNFFLSLKGQKPLGYSGVLSSKAAPEDNPTTHIVEKSEFPELKDENIQRETKKKERINWRKAKVLDLKEIDSHPEGGQTSKIGKQDEGIKIKSTKVDDKSGEAKTMLSRAIDKVKEKKNEFILSKVFQTIKENPSVKAFLNFCDTLIYFLKVVRGYIDFTNIILIYDLIKDFSLNLIGGVSSAIRLAHLGSVLVNLEKQSLMEFERLLLLINSGESTPLCLFSIDFGCLTTIIREWLLDQRFFSKNKGEYTCDAEKWKILYEKLKSMDILGFFGIFSQANVFRTPETGLFTDVNKYNERVREQNEKKSDFKRIVQALSSREESGIFSVITDICSKFPSKFGDGIKMFSQFAKTVLPIMMTFKVGVDIGKLLMSAVEKMYEWWTGKYSNAQEWLSQKKMKPGNPINALQCAFMIVRVKTKFPNQIPDISLERAREEYYEKKLKAEEYATQEGQYSMPFCSWVKSHAEAMSEPPTPLQRPYEPTVLCLKGAPGGGKSTIWPVILSKALGVQDEEDPIAAVKETTYTWNSRSEYQTGIVGKRVILFDDFGQDRSTSDEALNLISLVTSAAYPINSANITGPEIKGMFAVPEFIVICTNDASMNSEQLISKEAVERRLDLVLEFTEKFQSSNEEQMERKILKIVRCDRYSEFEEHAISPFEAATMYEMCDAFKKYSFSNLKDSVNSAIKKFSSRDFENFQPIKFDGNTPQSHPPISTNFAKDLEIFSAMKAKGGDKKTALKEVLADPKFKERGEYVKRGKDNDYGVWNNPSKKETNSYNSWGNPFDTVESQEEASDVYDHVLNVLAASFLTSIDLGVSTIIISAWAFAGKSISNMDLSFRSVGTALRSMLKAVVVTIAGCGIIYTIGRFLNGEESGTTKTAKNPAKALSSRPESSENVFYSMVKKATGTLRLNDGSTVNCIFIGGHYILTVCHFFQDFNSLKVLPEGTPITLTKSTWGGNLKKIYFNPNALIPLPNYENMVEGKTIRQDIIIYQLDKKTFNAEKKIWHHFWNAEHSLMNFDVSRVDYMSKRFYPIDEDEYIINKGKVTADHVHTKRVKGKDIYWHECAQASYEGRPASCGTIVMLPDRQEHPFLGIHIAATKLQNSSLFHFVTREEIDEALRNRIVIDVEEQGITEGTTDILPPNSIIEYIGAVKPAHQNIFTDLEKSTVFEMFGSHITEPSVLSPADPRLKERDDYTYVRKNFYKMLFEGYSQDPQFFESEMAEAAEYLKRKNKSIKAKSIVPQTIFNLHGCLNGLPFLPANTKVDLSTSSGYPYTVQHLRRKDLLSMDENEIIIPSQRVEDDFEHALDCLKKGIVPFAPFTLTIKDERIKLSKIYDQVKPRLFASGNLIHLLVSRRYYYSHVMAHYHSPETYSAIKIDRISLDWHEMILELMQVGQYGFDADYKFFDRSIGKLIMYLGSEIDLDYIKPKMIEEMGELGYRTFLEWDTAPYYVFQDKLFRGCGTQPSGRYTTYMGNCTMNELLHISAYLSLAAKNSPHLANIAAYVRNNRGKRGGDDTIQVVSENVSPFFNGVTFTEWVNERGMHATSASKTDEVVPLKPLHELSFLKNTTGYMRGFYVPISEKSSITEMMYWVRINKYNQDIHKATQDNINAALRCFYFYGPDEYNHIRDTILDKFPEYQLNSYSENRRIWDNYFYFPGSHSDYATRADQEGVDTTIVPQKYTEVNPVENTLVPMINEIESRPESGEDKATINNNIKHPNVPSQTIIDNNLRSENPDQSVDVVGKSRQEQLGTTVQESEKPIVMVPKTGDLEPKSTSKRAELHCNDINWTLEFLEQKYTVIKEVDWNLTNVFNDILVMLNLPNDILVTPAMKTPFDTTAYWRAKSIKLKVIVKSSPFYSGTLVAGFLPSMHNTDFNNFKSMSHVSQFVQMNSAIIHCSNNQEAEIMVPFRHPFGFLEAPKDGLGQFAIYVLNPLRTGAGNPNTVKVVVMAAIEQSEFKIPEYIPSKTYISHKFEQWDSYPQAGKTTQMSNIGQTSINDPVKDMKKVMLCAGTGLVGEPKIKQFQDHPTDLVQLEKRFRRLTIASTQIEPLGQTVVTIPLNQIISNVLGPFQFSFALYRGSILLKIVPYITCAKIADQEYRENLRFQVNVAMPPVTDLIKAEIYDAYSGGAHYFNYREPAEFMIPYLNPTFVSSRTNEDPFFQTNFEMMIYANNYNAAETVAVSYDIFACVADDFSMGVFKGISREGVYKYKNTIRPKIIKSMPQSGETTSKETDEEKELIVIVPKPEGSIGKPIRILMGPKIPGFNKGPLDLNQIIEKAKTRNYLTPSQIKKLVAYIYQKVIQKDDIFYDKEDEQIFARHPYIKTEVEEKLETDKFTGESSDDTIQEVWSDAEAGIIEFIDKAIDTTLPILEVVDDLTNLLDAHPVTYQRYPVTTRKIGYTVATDNIQYVERMLTTNHNGLSLADKECYGTSKRETDMYELSCNVKSLFSTFTWDTTQPYGTLLAKYAVGPLSKAEYPFIPPMDAFSSRFYYWTGSIIYIFDIAASEMHKGQLTVSFHPNLTMATAPSSLQEATQQYFVTFDLDRGAATTAVQVPYLNKKPYLPVNNLNGPDYPPNSGFNGIICVWIQNALRATTTVDKTVDINVYTVAGQDFRMDVYGSNLYFKQ